MIKYNKNKEGDKDFGKKICVDFIGFNDHMFDGQCFSCKYN